MDRISVTSSTLSEVGYDPVNGLLEIKFRSTAIYQYSNVPPHVFEGLLQASSKGSYFNRRIRNRYKTRRVWAG
jgi:KTSC domain-containing protein